MRVPACSEPRVDFLLHAHDIQGLGHVSRCVAIALALRRLRTATRVLIVSGCPEIAVLTDGLPIDFIKLPSYGSVVRDGRTFHTAGRAGIGFEETQAVRSDLLAALVATLQPRCVLVDHRPKGQCDELLAALDESRSQATRWHLGMRGIIGNVDGVWTEEAGALVRERYDRLLWYGDSAVLGDSFPEGVCAREPSPLGEGNRSARRDSPRSQIERQFGKAAFETGYVSRTVELERIGRLRRPNKPGRRAVFAASWCTPWTIGVVRKLVDAIAAGKLAGLIDSWDFFLGSGADGADKEAAFAAVDRVISIRRHQVEASYVEALAMADFAVLYAGYNMVTDALWARTPAVFIVRDNINHEQELHMAALQRAFPTGIATLPENSLSAEDLVESILNLAKSPPQVPSINTNGAEIAARFLMESVF